jgi:hypothetical protein
MSEASTMPNTPEPDPEDAVFCDDNCGFTDFDDLLGEGYFDVELNDLEAMKAEFMLSNSVGFNEAAGAYFSLSDLTGPESPSIETDEL